MFDRTGLDIAQGNISFLIFSRQISSHLSPLAQGPQNVHIFPKKQLD